MQPHVVLRSSASQDALIPFVRQAALEMGNDLSIQEIRPMRDIVAASVATQRFALQLIGLFALMALALALIGIYGVMSYAASRRTREIAIRSALGATRVDTAVLLLGHGARLIVAGLALGGIAALGLTRALADILYQVSPADPLTFAATAVILSAAAIAACFAPARKALNTEPITALRHE